MRKQDCQEERPPGFRRKNRYVDGFVGDRSCGKSVCVLYICVFAVCKCLCVFLKVCTLRREGHREKGCMWCNKERLLNCTRGEGQINQSAQCLSRQRKVGLKDHQACRTALVS